MTREQLPAEAISVKQAVCSATTCSEATVKSLKYLLDSEPIQKEATTKSNKNVGGAKAAVGSIRSTKKPSKLRSVVAVIEVHEDVGGQLDVRDKLKLATEVINAALKGLTEAIKAPLQPKPLRKRSSLSRTPSCQSAQESTPLRTRSANQVAGVPSNINGLCGSRRSSSVSCNAADQGVLALARCAREALAFLRKSCTQAENLVQLSPTQVETGMSALVNKMITLGLDDLATKELRILLRRLCPVQEIRHTKHTSMVQRQETLSDLFIAKDVPQEPARLALLATSQLQLLRLIAAKKRPATIEAALDHLKLSNPYSPINLVYRAACNVTERSGERPVQQLELFAQVLQTLVPNPSTDRDSVTKECRSVISPDVAVEYQLLVLEVRALWWKLSSHRIDLDKELLGPFSSVMLAFNRRSSWSHSQKYDFCSNSCARFLNLTEGLSHHQSMKMETRGIQSIKCDVSQIIADFASNASQWSDALHHLENCLDISRALGRSRICICSVLGRIVNVHLKSGCNIREGALTHLETLLKALRTDLSGESAELDELLFQTVRLQRLILTTLFGARKFDKAGDSTELLEKFTDSAIDFILECFLFLKRFLGKSPTSIASIRQTGRYAQRKALVGKLSTPVVESVVGLAKVIYTAESEKWRRVDSCLLNCITFLTEHENTEKAADLQPRLGQKSRHDWCQVISGVYWCRFLGLKQQSAPPEELLRNLETSVTFLEECPHDDQLQNQICARLIKLGSLYESLKKWNEAALTYTKSLDTQVTADCVSVAAASMSRRSLNIVLHEQTDLEMWNRTISGFSRTILKANSRNDRPEVYDRTDLSTSLRGMILEQQLATVKSTLLGVPLSETSKSTFNCLAHALLDVYEERQRPLRRMRVILSLLQAEMTWPSILTSKTREKLSKSPLSLLSQELEEDSGLSTYACHLASSHELATHFLERRPSIEVCRKVLHTWRSVMKVSRVGRLKDNVDNIPCWIKQLRMLAEFFEMQGLEVEYAETLRMCEQVQEGESGEPLDDLAFTRMNLGLQWLALGHSGRATLLLQKVKKQLCAIDLNQSTKFRWHLVSATHALQTISPAECQSHLSKANSLVAMDSSNDKTGYGVTEKLIQVSQKAHLSSVKAMDAFSRGSLGEAVFHGRWSVKLSYRAWALLEHKANRASRQSDTLMSIDPNSLTRNMTELSLADVKPPIVSSTKHESLNGCVFWALVPCLLQRLLFLSRLFAYGGSAPEAQYYLDQASKMADAVKAAPFQSQCLAIAGTLALRRSNCDVALQLLVNASDKLAKDQAALFHVRVHIALNEAYVFKLDWERASLSLRDAEKAIEKLETCDALAISTTYDEDQAHQAGWETLDSRLETLAINSKKNGLKVQRKNVQKLANRTGKRLETLTAPVATQNPFKSLDTLPLSRLRTAVKRQHAFQALERKQTKDAMVFLSEASNLPNALDELAIQVLWQAQAHFQQGLEEMGIDSVFGVLHESSISYPSMLVETACDHVQTAHLVSPTDKTAKANRAVTKAPAKKGARRSTQSSATFHDFFKQSFESLKRLILGSPANISSRIMHAISDRLIKATLMLSATSCSSSLQGLNPFFALYSSELGRCFSALREGSMMQAERLISQHDTKAQADHAEWKNTFSVTVDAHLNYTTFQESYVDFIPENWTAISISLSENRDELRLSKLRSHQTPFIAAIPLNRHNSRDADEEVFDFAQGKAELMEIIELANYSTHDERDFSKKGAKTQWWEARAALDARLHDLLVNIENIWLGGFRGLFGQQQQHPYLLARFKHSFGKILDKHVPSRRKVGRGGKNSIANRVELDPQVLELIIGLGDPNDSGDLDEPLLDLLYFVIDIMQFHGERNAYDEIDFDSIIVETLDALRQYYQALLQESQDKPQKHTILILDKAVHAFPWESLPCLKGQPVTRLPSLVHLRSCILNMQQHTTSTDPEEPAGLRINPQNTGYILNPSADLTSTQSTFFPLLTSLPSNSPTQTQIISRPPSASEFETALTSHSLLLYFGHGSGGQYVRSRTIQKLSRCAVALLLGCSSAKLVEEGEYEPHGMVNSYLAASAPAVVGTLWDVTDKDIDRWSLDCLERWGLFEEECRPVQESPTKKPRGRGKVKAGNGGGMMMGREKSKVRSLDEGGDAKGLRGREARGKVSLDEAVALARDKCLMKYLNGAAPVVYGIPVYLS